MPDIKKCFSRMLAAVKRAGKAAGKKIKAFFVNRNPAAWFVGLLSFSTVLFLIYALIGGYEAFMAPFFRSGKDMFMDYFNSVRDVSLGEGVYTVRHVIYPPMANLLFLIFLQFVPKEYAATEFVNRQAWVQYPSATFSVIVFLIVPMILLALLCATNLKGASAPKKAFGLFSIINYPVLYMVERGNILIYTVLATAVFVFYYNSESKVKRELALVALAFAFSLKIYPAILGAVLLTDKRYKDAIRCAVYALVLLVLPSFFFGGPSCLLTMLNNIRGFSSNRGGFSAESIIFWISFAVFLVAVFVQKDKTKLLIFGVAVLRVYPALASMYAWAFFLPVLCLIMNEKKKLNREEIAYFLLMAIPFNLIPGVEKTAYANFASALLYALLALCIAETAFTTWCFFKQRKAQALASGEEVSLARAEFAAGDTETATAEETAAASEGETANTTKETTNEKTEGEH